MPRNYEIKIKAENFPKLRKLINSLGFRFGVCEHYELIQKDIYFTSGKGRLKLRIINNNTANLIHYNRDESSAKMISKYVIHKTDNYKELLEILNNIHKTDVIVNKRREVYIFGNLRIHLDTVSELGKYLEFEIIYKKLSEARALMNLLIGHFGFDKKDFIRTSYSDLMKQKLKFNKQ